MSDQKFNSPNDPELVPQPAPASAEQPDAIRSAFNQQEDTPQLKPKQPSGMSGFFQNLFNTVKEVLGVGEDESAGGSTVDIRDINLLPVDEDYPNEQGQDLEPGFSFIEQERLILNAMEGPRTENISIPTDEITGSASKPEEEPQPLIENTFPSDKETQTFHNEEPLEEEVLDLTSFLPGINGFSKEESTTEPAEDRPSDQPQNPIQQAAPSAPKIDPAVFALDEQPQQKQNFTREDLNDFLPELDARESRTPGQIKPEEFNTESEQDEFDSLRAMFQDEDMSASVRDEGHPDLSDPQNQQTLNDDDFTITEEEIEALNPEDFLPESLRTGLEPDIFVFEDESGLVEENDTPQGQPELIPDQPIDSVKPFSFDDETRSYLDDLRTTFESDEPQPIQYQSPSENKPELAGSRKHTEKDPKKKAPDTTPSMDNNDLFSKFAAEKYEDTPRLEDEKPAKTGNGLAGFLSRFSKWSIKEELLVGAAVLFGMLVFATIIIVAINAIFLPLIRSFQLPDSNTSILEARAGVADPSVYPTSLKLPGGWVFTLQQSTIKEDRWEPAAAEYLQNATIRRVIAIPWSEQTEAVIATFEKGDELLLFMNNNDVKGYKVEEVKQVPQDDTSILLDTRPSLVVILYQPDAASRWVVVCKP